MSGRRGWHANLGEYVDTWHHGAACAGMPTTWWFSDTDTPQYRHAMVHCWRCPVRPQCAQHAFTYPEAFGIWGGTTEYDRRTVRRQAKGLTMKETLTMLDDVAREAAERRRLAYEQEETA